MILDYLTYLSQKKFQWFDPNGHDVIDFDYRNYSSKIFDEKNLDYKIISVVSHYKPDLILFGHNNVLSRNTLEILKINSTVNCPFGLKIMLLRVTLITKITLLYLREIMI